MMRMIPPRFYFRSLISKWLGSSSEDEAGKTSQEKTTREFTKAGLRGAKAGRKLRKKLMNDKKGWRPKQPIGKPTGSPPESPPLPPNILEDIKEAMEAIKKQTEYIANHHNMILEMYVAAYWNHTKIPPDQAVLVRQMQGNTVRWWFEKKQKTTNTSENIKKEAK